MEPNKVENQIREKLNAREIKPSVHAWDRLDAMLSVQEESATKNRFPWLKMAAGFILFLGVGYVFLTQNESQNQQFKSNEKVVESSNEETKLNTNKTDLVQNEIFSNAEIKEAKSVAEKTKTTLKTTVNQELLVQSSETKNQEYNSNIAQVKKEKTEEMPIAVLRNEAPLSIENKEAVAENKTHSKPKLKVDANALLNQVEGEVTLTFRQKVMKSMLKNYKDAKESFASRNLEESSNNQ